jgi:hypothetical protein
MRKILGLLCLLVLYFGVADYAIAQGTRTRLATPTTTGSQPPAGSVKLVGPDDHSFVKLKAQNHLSSALNQMLSRERSGTGGTMSDPGIKNGTADTIPYFNSWFITGSRNSIYPYSMVGHSPSNGGTTGVNNEVLTLGLLLCGPGQGYTCNFPGNPVNPGLFYFDPGFTLNDPQGTDEQLVVQSPLYDATTTYPGPPADTGQIVDTAQRTEFSSERTADWHTPLNTPAVNPAGAYYGVLSYDNGDWTYFCGTLVCPFPAANINTLSLYFGELLAVQNPPNSTFPIILTDYITAYDPSNFSCCVLGFHTDQAGVNPPGPTAILVWTWGTFIPHAGSNGLGNPFGAFGNDVMVLTHEISETYNDPFVNTNVAPWVDGSVSFAQGNLETGDTIEAMAPADVIYNTPLTTTGGPYTYTLQNVALLQWFTRDPFNSGPYSWPNEGSLSHNLHPPNFNALGSTAACSASPLSCWFYGEGSAGFFFGPPF